MRRSERGGQTFQVVIGDAVRARRQRRVARRIGPQRIDSRGQMSESPD